MSNIIPLQDLAAQFSDLWRNLRGSSYGAPLNPTQMEAAWQPVADTVHRMDGNQIDFNFMNQSLSVGHAAAFERFVGNPSIDHYAGWPNLAAAVDYYFHVVLSNTVIENGAAPPRINQSKDRIGLDYLALREHLVMPIKTLVINFSAQFQRAYGHDAEAVISLRPKMVSAIYKPAYKIDK